VGRANESVQSRLVLKWVSHNELEAAIDFTADFGIHLPGALQAPKVNPSAYFRHFSSIHLVSDDTRSLAVYFTPDVRNSVLAKLLAML
jgi:hypothetical protein